MGSFWKRKFNIIRNWKEFFQTGLVMLLIMQRIFFLKKGLVFDLYGLLLYIPEKEFNNAALCLSDQNPTITKFAVFQGLAVSTFFR